MEVTRYWAPDFRHVERRSDREWIEGLERRVDGAVARHLVSDVPVGALLVLDEATNAVDTATEMAIQSTISELAGDTTILIIAHRTSTLEKVDRVLVMEGGRIVEDVHPSRMSSSAALLAGVRTADEAPEREG